MKYCILLCTILMSCQSLKDPKVYEDVIELGKDVIEDEITEIKDHK